MFRFLLYLRTMMFYLIGLEEGPEEDASEEIDNGDNDNFEGRSLLNRIVARLDNARNKGYYIGDEIDILKFRELQGKNVVVVFLDLSTSISRIATSIASGYLKMRAALIESNRPKGNMHVILCGFNMGCHLLFEGTPATMPRYSAENFTYDQEESMLVNGSEMMGAIGVVGKLIPQLINAKRATIVCMSDGLPMDVSERESEARVALEQLRRFKIPITFQGILNPVFGRPEDLNDVCLFFDDPSISISTRKRERSRNAEEHAEGERPPLDPNVSKAEKSFDRASEFIRLSLETKVFRPEEMDTKFEKFKEDSDENADDKSDSNESGDNA